jgi:hypothetical protein
VTADRPAQTVEAMHEPHSAEYETVFLWILARKPA